MQKRYYFTLLLFICILSGHAQTIVLSPEDKKIFLKNFQTVLQHLPTKFAKIKTGGEDVDAGNRISWYKSSLQLFPGYSGKDANRIMFGTYSGKPVICFSESINVDVNTLVGILMPVLKAKGMIEVNSLYASMPEEGRSFRSKDAVLQITYYEPQKRADILIGKMPAYYEAGIKPVTLKKTPADTKEKTTSAAASNKKSNNNNGPFITKEAFEELMETICENRMHQKLKGNLKPEINKWYETTSTFNGVAKDMPVYYLQANMLRFTVKTGLSNNTRDLDKAAAYINGLFEKADACWEAYRNFRLEKDEEKQHYADVYAWDDGGMFVYVEKENGIVQLRIAKINYSEEQKNKTKNPALPVKGCDDMETILKECVTGFKNVKGAFLRKSTPNEYFSTTLPALGLKDKYVVESVSIDFVGDEMKRKKFVYYNAEENFTSSGDALRVYDKMKTALRNCYSGVANISDETNQKIFELFFDYNGQKIRAAIIYINFLSSSVSVSFRVLDD